MVNNYSTTNATLLDANEGTCVTNCLKEEKGDVSESGSEAGQPNILAIEFSC